ncbi:MAG: hypothetical protein AB8F65_10005 [Woeseiaceae bacterium]
MRSLKRELLIALIILVATIVVVFPLTYWVGGLTLGEYANGESLMSFLGSLFSALGTGSMAIWFFLLTPLLAISTLRLGWLTFRRL